MPFQSVVPMDIGVCIRVRSEVAKIRDLCNCVVCLDLLDRGALCV